MNKAKSKTSLDPNQTKLEIQPATNEAKSKGFMIYRSAPTDNGVVIVGITKDGKIRIYKRYWDSSNQKWAKGILWLRDLPIVAELCDIVFSDYVKMRKTGVV